MRRRSCRNKLFNFFGMTIYGRGTGAGHFFSSRNATCNIDTWLLVSILSIVMHGNITKRHDHNRVMVFSTTS